MFNRDASRPAEFKPSPLHRSAPFDQEPGCYHDAGLWLYESSQAIRPERETGKPKSVTYLGWLAFQGLPQTRRSANLKQNENLT